MKGRTWLGVMFVAAASSGAEAAAGQRLGRRDCVRGLAGGPVGGSFVSEGCANFWGCMWKLKIGLIAIIVIA